MTAHYYTLGHFYRRGSDALHASRGACRRHSRRLPGRTLRIVWVPHSCRVYAGSGGLARRGELLIVEEPSLLSAGRRVARYREGQEV